jgi:hypothetical protein
MDIPWKIRFMMGSFKLSNPCRYLCWDHASSWAFDNITLSLWPTLIQRPLWLQSLSRSAFMCQLAAVRNVGDAIWLAIGG